MSIKQIVEKNKTKDHIFMAKLAHYYLRFLDDNLFAQERWAERQQLLGELLAGDDCVTFEGNTPAQTNKEDGETKPLIYPHEVYHLRCAPDITVMRIANVKEVLIEKNFQPKTVEHNPSCFVIFDNRQGCRSVMIQKLSTSFNSTDQLMKILQRGLEKGLAVNNIGIEMNARRYPMDFYKLWRSQEHHTARIRFGIGSRESVPLDDVDNGNSLVGHILQIELASYKGGYKSALDLEPREKGGVLHVDDSSEYIRSLVKYSAQTGTPVELITLDGSSFKCFIDSDLESDDKIVTGDLEKEYLEQLFATGDCAKDIAEARVLEFVNGMKYVVDEKEEKQ